MAETVEADQKIPPEEKRSVIDSLKSLAGNERIRSIGTSVLADVIKNASVPTRLKSFAFWEQKW